MSVMKKLLFTLCVLFVATVAANAQSGYLISTTNGLTLDTVTNAGSRTQKLPIAGFQNVVSIQVGLISKTGTPAGVVRLYGSNNGTKFVRIPSYNNAGAIAVDSLLVGSTALDKVFVVKDSPYTYYQVTFAGSGTQSTTLSSYAIWRKQ